LEWSPWAVHHSVARDHVHHADARVGLTLFPTAEFGTVCSLDFLEHHTPEDGQAIIAQIARVTKLGGLSLHLIGAANPDHPTDCDTEPSHLNHEPLSWYDAAFREAGFRRRPELAKAVANHPAWAATDWAARWVAFWKAGA
jgi:hypothetical protein